MLIGIDFETHLIGNDAVYPKPICLSYYTGAGPGGIEVGMDAMEEKLRKILTSKATIIAHNATFECIVIYNWFPSLRKQLWDALYERRIVCTQICEQLIINVSKVNRQKTSLSELVKLYFEKDISETKKNDLFSWRLSYHILENIPLDMWPQQAKDYSLDDAKWTYEVYKQQKDLQKGQIAYHEHVLASFSLNLMAQDGLLIDKERVETLEKELLGVLNPKYQYLIDHGFAERDSSGKVKKKMVLFREHIKDNLEDYGLTDSGAVSTKAEQLKEYLAAKPDDEVIKTFLGIMDYEKVYTAFVKRLKKADPVVRSQYNSIVRSGRTSARASSLYPSVNIQQMPRGVDGVTWDIRNCFVPPEGYKFVSIDYNGLELISASYQLYTAIGYSNMRSLLNSGDVPVDLHSKLGARIMSMKDRSTCTYENFLENKKLKEYTEIRNIAKVIGLGKPGGIGRDIQRTQLISQGITPGYKEFEVSKWEKNIDSLVKRFKPKFPYIRKKRISKFEYALVYDEIVKFDEQLYAAYPELKEFLQEKHEKYQTGEIKRVKNKYGEWEDQDVYSYTTHGVSRDWCTYTEFCNGFLMQTPSAVGAKRAVNRIVEKYYEDENVQPLGFIHDEILFLAKEGPDMWDYIQDVSYIMCHAMQSCFPGTRIAVEASTMEYWSKADTIEDRTYFMNANSSTLNYLNEQEGTACPIQNSAKTLIANC